MRIEEREDVLREEDSTVDSSMEVQGSETSDEIRKDLEVENVDAKGSPGWEAVEGEGSRDVLVGVESEEGEGLDWSTV